MVLPRGAGVLAWLVTVAALADGTTPLAAADYYIDATTGDILSVQPVTGEGRVALPWAAAAATYLHRVHRSPATWSRPTPDPNSVEITGPNPIGGTLTGHGVQTDEGVVLRRHHHARRGTSSAGPAASRRTTPRGSTNSGQLPGKLVVSPDTKIRDAEAMAAQALSRDVYDYYASLGRDSWDGQGGSMVSSVHYGPSDFCNSFFTSSLRQPQMVYGNPCTTDAEGQAEVTEVEIDTAGHEITHGVTATSAGLKYTGQSGALNESFSDYFGNVIGNRVKGTDSVAIFEGGCTGYTEETLFCKPQPRRQPVAALHAQRQRLRRLPARPRPRLPAQAARLQQPGPGRRALQLRDLEQRALVDPGQPGQDRRQARQRLAARPGLRQGRVRRADHPARPDLGIPRRAGRGRAGDRRLRSSTRSCCAPPARSSTRRRSAPAAPTPAQLGGDTGGSASPSTQLHPVVSRDSVAWLDVSGDGDNFGYAASTKLGGATPSKGASSDVAEVAFGGDALVTLDLNGRINRYAADGGAATLDQVPFEADARGRAGRLRHRRRVGRRRRHGLVRRPGRPGHQRPGRPGCSGDTITGLGTGGGMVGIGTDGGQVLRLAARRPGSPRSASSTAR